LIRPLKLGVKITGTTSYAHLTGSKSSANDRFPDHHQHIRKSSIFNPPTKNQCTVTAKGRLMSFQLPPEITVSKDQIDSQWVFTFRHNELGNIGRIRLKGTGANTMINLDVIGPCTFP
jgi:hypothetical protein